MRIRGGDPKSWMSRAASTAKGIVSKAGRIGPALRAAGPEMASGAGRGLTISGAAIGANELGKLATQTKTGREIGKAIGDYVPGAKAAANALKPTQNYLRNLTGFGRFMDKKAAPSTAAAPAPTAKTSSPELSKSTTGKPTTFQRTPSVGPDATKFAPSAPKPAAPVAAPKETPTTSKSGYFKGGSMGDRTVKSGETLSGIAKQTGQSVADLAKMNKISDVNKISAGAKLMTKVPTPPSRPEPAATPAQTPAPAPAPKPAEPPVAAGFGSSQDLAKDIEKQKNVPKVAPTIRPMQESVQVGENKYRIV